jgi:hypothetical protein
MDIFRERLTPGVGLHVALLLLLPLGFGMVAPLSIVGGIANAVGIYLAAQAWLHLGAPQIRVTDTHLHAGRARIERSAIARPRTVLRDDRLEALSDARTWKVLRAWIPDGVLVDVIDAQDPTPSWYMSTRRPAELVAALAARGSSR